MGTLHGGKARAGRDADHSPPSSVEVKNVQELYFLPPLAPVWRSGTALLTFQKKMEKRKQRWTL
jgi:hypothetical protein